MTRKVKDIIKQLRRDIACPQIEVTLIQTEDLLALCDAAERKPKKLRKPSPEGIDRMVAAYRAEADRWCWRYRVPHDKRGSFELVRNSSPKNDINADEYFQITLLSRRECADRHHAEGRLRTYRGRAAMIAALEAL